MAQPSIEYFDQRAIALVATGTPSISTDAFDLIDGKSGTATGIVERPRDSAVLTHDDFDVTNEIAFVEGSFELAPPLTPGSASGVLGKTPAERALLPSALALALSSTNSTSRYTPISSSIPTANWKFWHAGTLKLVQNSRGKIDELSMMVEDRFKASGFRLEGVFDDVDEEDVPTTGDVSAFAKPAILTEANSVARIFVGDSTTALPIFVLAKGLKVKFGNELKTTVRTQLRSTKIRGRKGEFEFMIARTAKADFDPWAVRRAGTYIRGDITVIDDDGTRYSRLFFRGKIAEITEDDQDKEYGWTLKGRCRYLSAASPDYGIEFGLDSLRVIGDLPDGAAGAYSQQLSLQGVYGSAVVWSVLSGSLPGGTSIDSATGVVSGTATAGSTTCVIRATTTDLSGATITADSSSQAVVIT